tara:strand:+ start:100 stop:594 length:495 start_codon:yes stop_codon:yes gene_type:complete
MEDNKEAVEPIVEETIQPESWKSDKINELATALALAQSEMDGAAKKSTNPFFNSGYADLHEVISSSFPYLNKNGLSVVQGNEIIPGAVCVTTTLVHKSGQWIRSKIKVPMPKIDAQGIGTATTYGRRYGLAAMVGIAQKDDDGNSISNANPNSKVDKFNANRNK